MPASPASAIGEALSAPISREDVSPLVKILAKHIEQLEDQLIALKAERDQALAVSPQASWLITAAGQDTTIHEALNSRPPGSSLPSNLGNHPDNCALERHDGIERRKWFWGLIKGIFVLAALIITSSVFTLTGAAEHLSRKLSATWPHVGKEKRALLWFAPSETETSAPAANPNVSALTFRDIPRDVALLPLRHAAASGDLRATYELATRADLGRGLPRDVTLAATLFEAAAAGGFPPAQFRVGQFYEKGFGVRRDIRAALSWYQKAAENGNVLAMHHLAILLAEGLDGKSDYPAAITWFRRAAQYGLRDSQYNLATMLAGGLGTTEDLVGAYTWFEIVAATGDQDAAKRRQELEARLSSDERESARHAARHWQAEEPDFGANEAPSP